MQTRMVDEHSSCDRNVIESAFAGVKRNGIGTHDCGILFLVGFHLLRETAVRAAHEPKWFAAEFGRETPPRAQPAILATSRLAGTLLAVERRRLRGYARRGHTPHRREFGAGICNMRPTDAMAAACGS
jgi:hypothetical protein